MIIMPLISNTNQGKARQLDYRSAFEYWRELGTLEKARLGLARDGHTNPDGEPFSIHTIQAAAWMWIIENPKEALPYFQSEGHFLDGMDGDDWKVWITGKIRRFCNTSQRRFDAMLKINGIYEWYYEQEAYRQEPPIIHRTRKRIAPPGDE